MEEKNVKPIDHSKDGMSVATTDKNQAIETCAYVPTYKIKPEFKKAVLQAIGDRPFNEIAGLINAIDVNTIDHQTLSQIINAIGQFPYTRVENLLKNISNYVEQIIED
jgi:hypothetical protein